MVKDEEKKQFQNYIIEKIDRQKLEAEAKQKIAQDLQTEKMNKVVPKKTRPAIPRSKKKMKKKEEVKQVIDQDHLDMIKYLGEITQTQEA